MLGVVGAGRWGRNHLRHFAALGALGAVCDSSPEALDRVAQAFPDVTIYRDLADLLADGRIRAVVIATPAELHFPQAKAALAAGRPAGATLSLPKGRHVLVEKPMTLSLAEAEALDSMANERRLVLMVGHLLEYHPAFAKLRQLVSAGELGEIIRVHSRRLIPGVSGHQESVLWDLGPHDLSMILRLVGALPESVQATAVSTTEVADVVTLNLAFSGDLRAQILLSWRHPVKEQQLVVVGRLNTVVFDDTLQEGKLRLYPTRSEGAGSSDGVSPGPKPETRHPSPEALEPGPWPLAPGLPRLVPYPDDEPLRRECEHFLNCVETGGRPLTDGASGVRVTRVLEACERSLRAGGPAVSVGRS